MNYKEFLRKHKIKDADLVEVFTNKGEFTGTVIPAEQDSKELVLKLKNGYNAGIAIADIKSVKIVGCGKKVGKADAGAVKKDPKLPTIAILHTGGTIASRVNYETGGVISGFRPEDLLTMFPELQGKANFDCKLIANMMSEDLLFKDYKRIAEAIGDEVKKGARGVIIGHGTDTLAVTAAALSFALENLPIPVLIVGAQRSSDRGSSDAAMNLECAVEFIKKTDFAGVAICMHENTDDNDCLIMPATKTRKMHTSRRDAFKVVNDKAIARVDYKTKEIEYLRDNYARKSSGKFVVNGKFEEKVGLIKTHTNMHKDIFEVFTKKKYKGLVLEGTGIGQAPTNVKENLPIYDELKRFIKQGGVVVLTSQCIFGRVHKDIYTNCRRLADIGIIFGEDMLAETAFVKLAWLLGNYKKEEAEKLVAKNLRGEITPRTGIDSFEVSE